MSDLIFGRTWKQIQDRQQKRAGGILIAPVRKKNEATDADRKQLAELGVEGLKERELYGVLDRLKTSGLI